MTSAEFHLLRDLVLIGGTLAGLLIVAWDAMQAKARALTCACLVLALLLSGAFCFGVLHAAELSTAFCHSQPWWWQLLTGCYLLP